MESVLIITEWGRSDYNEYTVFQEKILKFYSDSH